LEGGGWRGRGEVERGDPVVVALEEGGEREGEVGGTVTFGGRRGGITKKKAQQFKSVVANFDASRSSRNGLKENKPSIPLLHTQRESLHTNLPNPIATCSLPTILVLSRSLSDFPLELVHHLVVENLSSRTRSNRSFLLDSLRSERDKRPESDVAVLRSGSEEKVGGGGGRVGEGGGGGGGGRRRWGRREIESSDPVEVTF